MPGCWRICFWILRPGANIVGSSLENPETPQLLEAALALLAEMVIGHVGRFLLEFLRGDDDEHSRHFFGDVVAAGLAKSPGRSGP